MSQDQAQEVLATVVRNQPKKRGCLRGCLLYGGVGLLVFALPIWWFCLHTTPLRVSKETTYVLGPLTADGKRIDYFRAMEEWSYPPEMKTDENGYRLVVRACGDLNGRYERVYNETKTSYYLKKVDDVDSLHRLQVYEKLGLNPDVKPTLEFESPDAIFGKLVADNPRDEAIDQLAQNYWQREKRLGRLWWTFEDFPLLEEWLAENTAAIDLLGEAIRKPVFRMPLVRLDENQSMLEAPLMGGLQEMREWARAAQARATYRIGIGDLDGAIDDIITTFRLGRHAGRQGMMISALIGIAIEGVAASVGINENPAFPPSKEQIERLLREIDALPPRITPEEYLESERLFGLEVMQDVYWGRVSKYQGQPILQLNPIHWARAIDINIYLARINQAYDALRDGTFDENDYKVSWNPLPFLFVRSRTNRFADIRARIILPAMQGAREAWNRCECGTNMQRLTLAFLLYEKDHGGLPGGDWREAVKPYLGPEPEKYFRCPSRHLPEGETAYALLDRGDDAAASPHQILLVEVSRPQKLGEGNGRLPLEKARFWQKDPDRPQEQRPADFDGLGSTHTRCINVGYRSGAVQRLDETAKPEEVARLLDGPASEERPQK